MSRKKLIWYPGAIYHIVTRGNRRSNIFEDNEDRMVYFYKLKESLEKYSGEIYCYCLMSNHVHMIIKTGDITISKIMKKLNELYARYFNMKYNLSGHLFQGRYYWELVEDDKYLLEVTRYIHLNPVRANMVKKPEEYAWSSYRMFIGKDSENLINSEKILSYFNSDNRRKRYREFIEEKQIGVRPSP